jgi:uncharacterized DUF497 family protein
MATRHGSTVGKIRRPTEQWQPRRSSQKFKPLWTPPKPGRLTGAPKNIYSPQSNGASVTAHKNRSPAANSLQKHTLAEVKSSVAPRLLTIPFVEARTAFLDDNARVLPDPDHSDDEERFVLLGLSISVRVLVICHCYRHGDEVIHIISARRANREEIKQCQWRMR